MYDCLIELFIVSLTKVMQYTAVRNYAADMGNVRLILFKEVPTLP